MKKLTVTVDDDLYTATKVEAARHNRKLRDVVADALLEWLEMREDLQLLEEALAEDGETGGIELDEAFRQLEAERKSA